MSRMLWAILSGGLGVAVLTALLLRGAHREGSEPVVGEWARGHGLVLTAANRPVASYYLVLGRVLRTVGGVGGLVLAFLVHAATGVDVAGGYLWWVWIMGGYLAGAMWAELFLTRPTPNGRAASLFPRLLPDYLPARLRWSLRLAGVASLVVGVVAWAVEADSIDGWRVGAGPGRSGATAFSPALSPGAALGLGLSGVVLALLVEMLQRTIVRRPQPLMAADLLEADDAIRASSVHTLAGAGLGMVVLIVATISTRLIEAAGRLPFGLGATPLILTVAGLLGWRYYSHRAWKVRRPRPMQPAAP